jgi:hypothetical protein
MLPTHQIETFLERTPPHLQDIVFELRNIITNVAPDAVEAVRWGGLSYFHEGRGGIVSAGICQIGIHEDHIRLAFIHGVHVYDPRHFLEGKEKSKRYVRIDSYENASWSYLRKLIESASRFDPYSIQM